MEGRVTRHTHRAPARKGVIADFNAPELMIRGLIKKASTTEQLVLSFTLRMVVGLPSGSSEVEVRAVRDSSVHADGRDGIYDSRANGRCSRYRPRC